MKSHIENFAKYLQEGYSIAQKNERNGIEQKPQNLVMIGMGGSGMAANLIETLIQQSNSGCPTLVVKDYQVPAWVNSSTLMIVCSYSGNTEETVAAMKDGLRKGAQMIAVTSGGELLDFAHQEDQTVVAIPTGIEPRAALPYSFAIQLYIVEQLGLIQNNIQGAISRLAKYCEESSTVTKLRAEKLAKQIASTIPIIYTTPNFEGCAIRLHQQLNENSRMLCWHQIIPEMNHNELLGWQEENHHVKGIFLNDPEEKEINKTRYRLTKKVLDDRKTPYFDINSSGTSILEKMLSTIYEIDRISYYTAKERHVDPNGMEIIERLKGELKKDTSPR